MSADVNRREFIGLAGAYAVAAPMARGAKAAKKRPNIVVIMADDHGAWASGPYGCRDIHTPNMDALAAGGAVFTNARTATPVCSPSRMTYLTGVLPSTHGVQDYLLPEDSTGPASREFLSGHLTYTELLARHGYALGMCGKWHMGMDERAQCGFTDWNVMPSGGGSYRDAVFVRNGTRTPTVGFREDHLGDYALEFLERQRGAEKPFYLAVNFFAPHTPYDFQPEVYRAPYAASEFECFPREPVNPHEHPELRSLEGKRSSMLGYSALVTAVDANVGRIVAKLEALGIREETLVIYTADHGWNAGQHGVWGKGNGTIPLNLYEESVRVPLIWNMPGRIRAGQRISSSVANYDFFPTMLEFAGITPPKDSRRIGRSYLAYVSDEHYDVADAGDIFFEYAYMRGVYNEFSKMKYIERTDKWPSEMYDLAKDPGETQNIIDDPAYATRKKEMRDAMAERFASVGAPPLTEWRSTTQQKLPWESDLEGGQSNAHWKAI